MNISKASPLDPRTTPRVTRLLLLASDLFRDLLALIYSVLGRQFAYEWSRIFAHFIYAALPELRRISERQCAAALEASRARGDPRRIARQAFLHRVWDIADVLLADRWMRRQAISRVCPELDARLRIEVKTAQQARVPVIFVTAYYGPFDLLPLILGYYGFRAAVLFKPHANAHFDRLRRRVRAMAGCELVTVDDALTRLPAVLDAGGMIGVVADHDSPRRGIQTHFLGLPTTAPRTIGLLAARHRAQVVVAAIRRTRSPFRFAIELGEIVRPNEWEHAADPVAQITQRYLAALESIVLRDPSQYHWARARWGLQRHADAMR